MNRIHLSKPQIALLIGLCTMAVLACIGRFAYDTWGHRVIEEMYVGTHPYQSLNEVIKRQNVHAVDFYLTKADQVVSSIFWLVFLCLPLSAVSIWASVRWPRSVFTKALPSSIAILACLSWIYFWLEIPLLQFLPGWFWSVQSKPLPSWWLVLPILVAAIAISRTILRNPERQARNLLLLILLGFFLQQGFAWMEGRGLDGIRDRMVNTGHRDFALEAVKQNDVWRVATEYESLLENGNLARYPHATKPPGQLIFYMFVERLSSLFGFFLPQNDLPRLTSFASFLFPVLTYLSVIPLFFYPEASQTTVPPGSLPSPMFVCPVLP